MRINKLTDYGIVILTTLAREFGRGLSAREISKITEIPLPTVGKVLKLLAKAGILISERGVHGGYRLQKPAREVNMAEVIAVFEGELALTECSEGKGVCFFEGHCSLRGNWRKINKVIFDALQKLSLQDMVQPISVATLDSVFHPESRLASGLKNQEVPT